MRHNRTTITTSGIRARLGGNASRTLVVDTGDLIHLANRRSWRLDDAWWSCGRGRPGTDPMARRVADPLPANAVSWALRVLQDTEPARRVTWWRRRGRLSNSTNMIRHDLRCRRRQWRDPPRIGMRRRRLDASTGHNRHSRSRRRGRTIGSNGRRWRRRGLSDMACRLRRRRGRGRRQRRKVCFETLLMRAIPACVVLNSLWRRRARQQLSPKLLDLGTGRRECLEALIR